MRSSNVGGEGLSPDMTRKSRTCCGARRVSEDLTVIFFVYEAPERNTVICSKEAAAEKRADD